jgi:D-alanine transaminase
MSICYLDGEFMAREAARISPMDRGFLFGDGAYEVIPVYGRRPFRLPEHLARLERTLAAIRLANPLDAAAWTATIAELVARNPWDDQAVYVQVTRGVGAQRNHAFPVPTVPTVFLMSDALVPPPPALVASGVGAVTAADFRWLRCDLKTVSLLANCLLRQQAVDVGCAETILFRDGFLTEGAASNIFVVRDGVVLAPPKSHLMLPGITYDVVLELAARHRMPHAVRELTEQEVRTADEVWMTSSSKEVLAVTRLDERPVGTGAPGPLAQRMYAYYQQFKERERQA